MDSTLMGAVGELIQQRTRAQLLRDWEGNQADTVRFGELYARLAARAGRMAIAIAMKAAFEIGVVRKARV